MRLSVCFELVVLGILCTWLNGCSDTAKEKRELLQAAHEVFPEFEEARVSKPLDGRFKLAKGEYVSLISSSGDAGSNGTNDPEAGISKKWIITDGVGDQLVLSVQLPSHHLQLGLYYVGREGMSAEERDSVEQEIEAYVEKFMMYLRTGSGSNE